MLTDITARKRAEEALRRARAELELRVEARDTDLAQAIERLRAEIARRRDAQDALRESQERLRISERMASVGTLASGVAHEINNPVGMILLAAHSGLRCTDRPDAEEIRDRSFETIVRNTERCGRIVRSMLQFARQEPTEKWPVDLNALIEQVIQGAQSYLSHHHATTDLELDRSLPHVTLNPLEIEQVVINLVHNAVEAADHPVHITIRSRREPRKVILEVQDDGPGLTPDQTRHLFDPFYTTRREQGGTGLGLSVVHGIVTEHQGQVRIESEPGSGATIIIELPLEAAKPEETHHVESTGR